MGPSDLAGTLPPAATRHLLHDARNHVGNLAGLGRVLAEFSVHPDAALFLRCMHHEAQQLAQLLDTLCALAQGGDAGEPERRFDGGDQLLLAAHAVRPLAQEAGVALHTTVPELPVMTFGKPLLLGRLLSNLVRNAVLHARARRVEVSLDVDGDDLVYRVRDDGVGFTGAPPPGVRPSGGIGHGHGLGICRAIAACLGATLQIGHADGGGTEARLRVPVDPRTDP